LKDGHCLINYPELGMVGESKKFVGQLIFSRVMLRRRG